MPQNVLEKMFAHNNWANLEVIRACSALTDEQLDAQPESTTKGTIRTTIVHLMSSQVGYLELLTLPLEKRSQDRRVQYSELEEAAKKSGEGYLTLTRGEAPLPEGQIQSSDGYLFDPWVVMVQVINHGNEHREQISSMISALGIEPPGLDSWSFAEAENALVPVSK